MKLDELPPIAAVHILKYLNWRKQLRMSTLSKYFYAAVADAQLLEKVRYFTEGYRETEALYQLYNGLPNWQLSRISFIIGVLYLAHSRKYRLSFHNCPRKSVFWKGSSRSEFAFINRLLLSVAQDEFPLIKDFVVSGVYVKY